jgi:peptide/nickel transport system substrate-binding protein|tara:strand:+ start:4283 stop:5953 length:1671 start_codon:yes stop_codon:yes gene_type:complete
VRKSYIILLTLALLFTACGGGTDTSTDESAVTEESSESLETPAVTVATESLSGQKTGETFTMLMPALPSNADFAVYQGTASTAVAAVWAGPLLEFKAQDDPSMQPAIDDVQCFICESFSTDSDGNITIVLPEGLKSAAGNEITSDDVVYTLERAQANDFVWRFLMGVGSWDTENPITKVDNKTFTVNVTNNVPFTLGTLAWYSGSILDATEVKSHATEEDPWAKEWMAGNSATFGPYHLSSFSSGENATLSLNPGWNKFVPTYSDVVLTAVPDSATRLQALLTGAADYTFKVDYDQLASAAGNSMVTITEALESRSVELHLNFADEKFADKKVRQAINYAIDRDSIVEGIMGKYGAAANTQLPEVVKGPAAPGTYTQDVEKAKALLAEAGYADGFDMVITVNAVRPGNYASNVALLIANQLADIGINATISVYPSATDFEASIKDDSFEAWLWDSTPALSDPYYYWRLNHHPTLAFQNYKGYENADFVEKMDILFVTPAGPARDALITEIHSILLEDIPMVRIAQPTNAGVLRSGVENFRTTTLNAVLVHYLVENY